MEWFTFIVILLFVANTRSQDSMSLSHTLEDGVEEILVPMCKNFLLYSHTKLPNDYGHATQVEVYRHIEHFWSYMDYGCSLNFRRFVCSLYLPKYDLETRQVEKPCKETCSIAKRKCKKTMKQTRSRWPRQWRCNNFDPESSETCVGPLREPRRRNRNQMHMYCTDIPLTQCQNVPYPLGSLPNLFLQRNVTELQIEMNYFDSLISTGCHDHLTLFLCGTYVPFCVHNQNPFTIPCKELCEEVKQSCESHFQLLNGGLPWPQKLQCHRFPSAESQENMQCFLPGDA